MFFSFFVLLSSFAAEVPPVVQSALPGCEMRKETHFLSQEQVNSAKKLSEGEIPSRLLVRFAGNCGKSGKIFAYADSHLVRTKKEVVLVLVNAAEELVNVSLIATDEPPEYVPRENWYQRFTGKKLDRNLQLKRQIDAVSGATLTVRSTTEAVRRVLALHQVLKPEVK